MSTPHTPGAPDAPDAPTTPNAADAADAPATISLLPGGLRDVLPPDAAHEASVVARLLARFAAHGYEQASPPLVEFEDSLLRGAGAATSHHTFRLMDPVSRRMMGVRADMTGQMARVARDRLTRAPRPLRLCYAGQILRITADQLQPERQLTQVGCELIGADDPAADLEAIGLAVLGLRDCGFTDLVVDLGLPTLAMILLAHGGATPQQATAARAALDRRDGTALAAVGGPAVAPLQRLLAGSGAPARALETLAAMDLPPDAARMQQRLAAVLAQLTTHLPDCGISVDLVENRGFEYQTGLSFTLFARGARGELGRGGRYLIGNAGGEDAIGFSLYLEALMRMVPPPPIPRRVWLPPSCSWAVGERLRDDGWVTVAGLESTAPKDGTATALAREARRMGCSHYLTGESAESGESAVPVPVALDPEPAGESSPASSSDPGYEGEGA